MDGFIEAASEEEIDVALVELAADRWNCRPPMTDLYTDDFAAFEQFGETTESLEREAKLKGGALYGSSVYKD